MTSVAQAAEAREALRRACRKAVHATEAARILGTTGAALDKAYARGMLEGIAWILPALDILSIDEAERIEAEYGLIYRR